MGGRRELYGDNVVRADQIRRVGTQPQAPLFVQLYLDDGDHVSVQLGGLGERIEPKILETIATGLMEAVFAAAALPGSHRIEVAREDGKVTGWQRVPLPAEPPSAA
ncbi:hypothetical protein ABH931_007414 [Streptacidiphilus sp. MAP12-33]|uniref:hypothetical protein n=1 Tax=Streptacidiphilus sp. MAP12-33 TaxID=3156266 RepID=UPI0035185C86